MKILYNVTDELKANIEIAKEQDEYQTLPAYVFPNGLICCCISFDGDELEEITRTGKVYVSHMTFKSPLQPFFITGSQDLFKEHIQIYKE